MKKNWLKGVLLGVSMALLLAGGVALANGVWVRVSKPCVTCVPLGSVPKAENYVKVTFGGWNVGDYLCFRWKIGSLVYIDNCSVAPEPPPIVMEPLSFPCELRRNHLMDVPVLGDGFVPSAVPDTLLGEHNFRLTVEEPIGTVVDSASASLLVARVCEEEFVPEPGTILLLGSGLAGLAGYASLRWRSKE